MFVIKVLFLVFLCVSDSLGVTNKESTHFRNDYKFDARANGWFKVHPVPVDWQTAKTICHYEGAELASPLNSEMLESIRDLVKNSEPKKSVYHSGVHQTHANGMYMSIEGVPLEKLYMGQFSDGEPNNYAERQDCLAYSNDDTIWDVNCPNYYPFICYRKYSDTNLSQCGTVDPNYLLDPSAPFFNLHEMNYQSSENVTTKSKHCYKMHLGGRTWKQANLICQAEGGYLAIINSEKEANVLTNLFRYTSACSDTMCSEYSAYNDTLAIGYRESEANGGWWTIHGQTLEEAGFKKWASGQPDIPYDQVASTSTRRKSCGGFKSTKLVNIYCDVPYGFICEKEIDSLTK